MRGKIGAIPEPRERHLYQEAKELVAEVVVVTVFVWMVPAVLNLAGVEHRSNTVVSVNLLRHQLRRHLAVRSPRQLLFW